jgi:membrane fusion protein (multidrug efflux system)
LAGAVVLLAVFACGGGGWGERYGGGGDRDWGEDKSDIAGPERRVYVAEAAVERGSVADHLVTSGTLEGEFQADLFPEATGIVSRIYVEEGEQIEAGRTLALISNPSLDAGAERASVDVAKARRSLDEAQGLHSSGAISDKELQDARDVLAMSEASYGEATRTRGFTRIDSPIAGTVSIREVRVGELANSGRRAFQVVDLSKLRVMVQLPERDLPRISVGQTALLTGAYDDEVEVDGAISRISPVVDPTTGTVKVTVDVEADQTVIRPGQYVKVRVEVDRHADVLTIPRRALVWDDGEPIAWKIVDAPIEEASAETRAEAEESSGGPIARWFRSRDAEEETDDPSDPWEGIPRRGVEKVRLEIGFIDTERVEITDGLTLGEQVVRVGGGGLRAETLVKLPGDPNPGDGDNEDDKASKNLAEPPEGAEG